MDRRSFLRAAASVAGLGMGACTRRVPVLTPAAASPLPFYDALAPIIPIRAHIDRIFRVTVCLRPFRAVGPRIETERLGDKLIVHNYGHGGSGGHFRGARRIWLCGWRWSLALPSGSWR
jgi:hypothetical protein